MKFVIQRVNHASVEVDGAVVGKINKGLLVFIGVSNNDTKEIAERETAPVLWMPVLRSLQMNYMNT